MYCSLLMHPVDLIQMCEVDSSALGIIVRSCQLIDQGTQQTTLFKIRSPYFTWKMGALCLSNEASMVIGINVDKEQKLPKCYRNNRMENGLAVQILLEYERVKVVAFCLSLASLNVIQLKCSVNQQIKQMFYAGH
ncbi:hypothetical protein Peur_023989 [Populus x canadensis]